MWLPPTASYSFVGKFTVYASLQPSTATYRWLPVKWHHFRVTSGHIRSRDIISCHVTPSNCELQPFRKLNVQYTLVFGLLQALEGEFRSNDVTSWSLPVTWGRETFSCHVTPSYCKLKPCRKWYVQYPWLFRLLHPFPSNFQLNDVTSWPLPATLVHVTSFLVTWWPPTASHSLVGRKMYSVSEF